MTKYFIHKIHKDLEMVSFPVIEGYSFKPKSLNSSYIKVNEVRMVDRDMIEKILTMKFDKAFKRVVALVMHVLEDEEADEGDTTIVLGEVELVREILLNRYQKFLDKEKEELFLKKLRLLENELRMKQVKIKQKMQIYEMEEQKTKGRGR